MKNPLKWLSRSLVMIGLSLVWRSRSGLVSHPLVGSCRCLLSFHDTSEGEIRQAHVAANLLVAGVGLAAQFCERFGEPDDLLFGIVKAERDPIGGWLRCIADDDIALA